MTALLSATACSADALQSCVAEKLEPGLSVIGLMRSEKLDMTKARLVTQLFEGDDAKLAKLKPMFALTDWTFASDGPGRMILSAHRVVDESWVKDSTNRMCAAAAAAEVVWDGWDVDVAADGGQK
ncbi:hypothetical protein FJQ54_16915 [Sandaracinobacter neustonicus]|uniref:Uncharacterized protein n=1 Tax=Sandaracinobacter neustonicus TaxID=1715348 RepID=A0A501XE09_9SPHN|nr:hypothetical protein [Sandaracinobacter neustonicus]TPE58726.1 hypothetical protein FJQ54_16915 [Sandaracinobacter neustonicus]